MRQSIKTHIICKLTISIVAFIAAIVLLLTPATGCSKNKLVIEDATGQTQTLDQPIERVCSSHNPTMNDIVTLGGGDKYVAGFAFKDKAEGLYEKVIDNWDDIQSVWNGKNIDVEAVKQMNAQLCFIPETQTKVISSFEEAGVPCFIALPQTESFQSVKESMLRIAKVLNCEDRANTLIDECKKLIAEAQSCAQLDNATPHVVFLATSKNKVYTGGSFQNSIIEFSGGINPAKNLDNTKQSAQITEEELAQYNPDVIWIPDYAEYNIDDVLNSPGLADTNAVKNKRVYQFPCLLEPWDFPNMSCCLGVCWGSYNLHPNTYSFDKLIKSCNEFYSAVYNKTFTAEEMGIN